jgi:hypothetical protein
VSPSQESHISFLTSFKHILDALFQVEILVPAGTQRGILFSAIRIPVIIIVKARCQLSKLDRVSLPQGVNSVQKII